ncbi:MAG: bifunctional precorrin-2 dehydrogenase/sirohydrochlorin ferrochelatase [Armatimonadetes bacterium]|nr:bifunctional precorrin-2 dehydrogenase/sirohydrochlorin ferrochelatase [Armatimonadota bacterium]
MSGYYPVALKVGGRRAVVVGAGAVALRKVETLLECGAVVCVVAPEAVPEVTRLADEGCLELRRRAYEPADLEGAFLVVAATDSPAVNTGVAEDARARGVLVNSADPPEVSDFLVASGIRRGDLQIGIFTGGASPALSRRIRERLETVIGPEYGELAALLGRLRPEVIAARPTDRARARVWHRILDSDVLELLRAGRAAEAEARARGIIGDYGSIEILK